MRKFFKNSSETQHILTHTRDGGKRSRECNNTEILVNTHTRARNNNEREKKKRMKNGSAQKKKKSVGKGQLSLKCDY